MDLEQMEKILSNKKILITGHTGFTGTWARLWLEIIGAEYIGLSSRNRGHYLMDELISFESNTNFICDITNSELVFEIFQRVKPNYVLHLAAQPIVSLSYLNPFETITSNAQGTAVILEACRRTNSVENVVCVTTDKVYKNLETKKSFKESDELGGSDPYSASKTAAEFIIKAYERVFDENQSKINLNVARGGNIIGGGDYSLDRIIPDIVRSIIEDKPLCVRQPNSTRPWQHVLALIHGYFLLLTRQESEQKPPSNTWNFGPNNNSEFSVSEIIELFGQHWKKPKLKNQEIRFQESKYLSIDSSKARSILEWEPKWNLQETLFKTIEWYKGVHEDSTDAKKLSKIQLQSYRNSLDI
jgi:CDP-glucose 4,6-dehydratase